MISKIDTSCNESSCSLQNTMAVTHVVGVKARAYTFATSSTSCKSPSFPTIISHMMTHLVILLIILLKVEHRQPKSEMYGAKLVEYYIILVHVLPNSKLQRYNRTAVAQNIS